MLKSYHKKLGRDMVVIYPGEHYVTQEDEVIATILGSCISVCIKDRKNGIGGMNHFMLPGNIKDKSPLHSNSGRYGMYAMELILGDIIKMGGDRSNLSAKVFGGAHVLGAMPYTQKSVPSSNIRFISSFLSAEGIPVITSDVGGGSGRKLLYLPQPNRAFVKKLQNGLSHNLCKKEHGVRDDLKKQMNQEEVTFF